MDENDAAKNEGTPNSETGDVSPAGIPAEGAESKSDGPKKTDSENNQSVHLPVAKSFGRWVLDKVQEASLADWVIALATIGMFVTSFYQWRAIKGQLGEMQNSGTQTDKMIAAANQIKCALITANGQNSDAVEKTLRQNQTQFDATLDQVKKQSAAMQHAGDLSAQQLELSERPWVEADIAIDGPLTFDINGARIPLKITLRNTGHSPALSTTVSPVALIGSKSLSAVTYRNQVCQDAARTAVAYPQWGVALFPNASFQRSYTVILTQKDIDAGKASTENPKANFGEVMMSPSVIICVAYRPSFNNTSMYDTAYIVDLVKFHTINNAPPVIFDIGQAVEQQNLGLRSHMLDGAITAH